MEDYSAKWREYKKLRNLYLIITGYRFTLWRCPRCGNTFTDWWRLTQGYSLSDAFTAVYQSTLSMRSNWVTGRVANNNYATGFLRALAEPLFGFLDGAEAQAGASTRIAR